MIKKILQKVFPSELARGTFILFMTMNASNVLNFLFHFFMGRALEPEGYGVLAVLMSFIYIYSVPNEAIQNLISRYTSKLNLRKNYGKIKFLMLKALRRSFYVSAIIFGVATVLTLFLSRILGINFWLIFLINITIFFAFSIPIVRGVLQGTKKFSRLGNSMVIESGLKLFFSISLVIFGLKVFGAVMGILISLFAALIFSLYFNKEVLREEKENATFKEIYVTSIPYFTIMLAIFLFFSLDIIFAKVYFSSEMAGKYAVLSMLGKAIFLATFAVSKAMFPLASEQKDKKEDSSKLFKKSLLIIVSLCAAIIILYAFIPKIVISILYGKEYIEMYPYLVYSGLAFSFLSLSNLILVYGLSINKLRKIHYLFLFLILEVVLFSLFHNTILEYIFSFMVSNIIMFIGSLFFLKK